MLYPVYELMRKIKPGTLIEVTQDWDMYALKGDHLMVVKHWPAEGDHGATLECLVPRLERPKFFGDDYFGTHFKIVWEPE